MVVFYVHVTSATVLLYFNSSTEISEVRKFYSPINMSVGINMFMNGKLDSSFLTFICARLKFQNRPFYSCVLSYLAMNASEAGVELALIQTSLLFSCKCQLFSIRTT